MKKRLLTLILALMAVVIDASAKTVYVYPQGWDNLTGCKIAAYGWSPSQIFDDMTLDTTYPTCYKIDVPDNENTLIFCKLAATAVNDWDNVSLQTQNVNVELTSGQESDILVIIQDNYEINSGKRIYYTTVTTIDQLDNHLVGYYLVGSFNTTNPWAKDAAYEMTSMGDGTYKFEGLQLTTSDMVKVVKTKKSSTNVLTWYPNGMENNQTVSENGTYTVYFRPAGDGTAADGYAYIPNGNDANANGCTNGGYMFKFVKEATTPTVTLSADATEYDFGTTNQGTLVKHSFTVTNSSSDVVQASVTTPSGFDWEKMLLFTNNLNWSTVNMYSWGSDGNALTGGWPGNALNRFITNSYGETQYLATVPAEAVGIIFNNGTTQTEDLSNFDVTGYYVGGSWGSEPLLTVPANSSVAFSVYLKADDSGEKSGDVVLTPTSGDPVSIAVTGNVTHTPTPGATTQENVLPPTCGNMGSYDEVVYCTGCGEELSRNTVYTEALGHDLGEIVTPPTCTENGYTTHACSRCEYFYTDTETPALGHNFSAWATADGLTKHTCGRCGQSEYRLPFADGFETGDMSLGWTSEGDGAWTIGVGDYSSSTGANSGSYNAKILHANTGDETFLVSPVLDLNGASSATLNFHYVNRSWSGDFDQLGVYYRVDKGPWNELFLTDEPHGVWTEKSVELEGLAYGYQIGFKMKDGYGYGIAVDDVSISSENAGPTGIPIDEEHFPDEAMRNNMKNGNIDKDHNEFLSEDELSATRLSFIPGYYGKITDMTGIGYFTALKELFCQGNAMVGEAVDAMIAELPTRTGNDGVLYFQNDGGDQNVITLTQINAAKAKGWQVMTQYGSGWDESVGILLPVSFYTYDHTTYKSTYVHLSEENIGSVNDLLHAKGMTAEGSFTYDKDNHIITFNNFKTNAIFYNDYQLIDRQYGNTNNLTLTCNVIGENEFGGVIFNYENYVQLKGSGTMTSVGSNISAWSIKKMTIDGPTLIIDAYDYEDANGLSIDNGSGDVELEILSGTIQAKATGYPLVVSAYHANAFITLGKGMEVLEPEGATLVSKWEGESFLAVDAEGDLLQNTTLVIGKVPAAGIPVDETNFPNGNFRKFVSDMFDTDGSQTLSEEEIAAVTQMTINWKGITDLTGIENFTALKKLSCNLNNLTQLDLSALTELEVLNCSDNRLTSLDLSKNTKLRYLTCSNNRLTSLDLSNNPLLCEVNCDRNRLTSLDLSNNLLLRRLSIHGNHIYGLEMDELINSLPRLKEGITPNLAKPTFNVSDSDEEADSQTATEGALYAVNTTDSQEGNAISDEQLGEAIAKGWKVYVYDPQTSRWILCSQATGIQGVNSDQSEDVMYDLQGHRIKGNGQSPKVVIKNGKKVIMK